MQVILTVLSKPITVGRRLSLKLVVSSSNFTWLWTGRD